MSENTIKFTHVPDGEIQCSNGKTVYSNLFMLGAFALTARHSITNDGNHYEFATNMEGLERLIMKSDDTLQFMQNAIAALGQVMTDDESEYVKENSRELNWLVVGLSELSTMVANNLSEMNYALRSIQINKANK